MPIVLKSGSLILLEPSGPVQACNGIALPLPLRIRTSKSKRHLGEYEAFGVDWVQLVQDPIHFRIIMTMLSFSLGFYKSQRLAYKQIHIYILWLVSCKKSVISAK